MATSTARTQNVKVINGTVIMVDSHPLPAKPKTATRKARPASKMGIIGIVDANGQYVEVTDFGKAWEGVKVDAQYRAIVDIQTGTKNGYTNTYHNLVRLLPAAKVAPTTA